MLTRTTSAPRFAMCKSGELKAEVSGFISTANYDSVEQPIERRQFFSETFTLG